MTQEIYARKKRHANACRFFVVALMSHPQKTGHALVRMAGFS